MVILKVRIVDWSSLKKRQDSGKKRKNVSKRKKKKKTSTTVTEMETSIAFVEVQ